MGGSKKKLYLVDISSFIFRAFFAIRKLSTSKGLPVNAVYGVTTMMLNLIEKYKPDYMACVFDTPAPSFRKEMYAEYKSNRGAPPDELLPQFDWIKKAVDAMGIHGIELPGFEADDLIASLATKYADLETVIVSGDKDLMQLVTDDVKLLDTMKNILYGREEVKEKLGVYPELVADYLGLIGDSSDNIPGVAGIGPKSAVELISTYGNLEKILASTDKMKPSKKVETLKEMAHVAKLSKELATVRCDLMEQIKDHKLEDMNAPRAFTQAFVNFLNEMEFKSLALKYSTALGKSADALVASVQSEEEKTEKVEKHSIGGASEFKNYLNSLNLKLLSVDMTEETNSYSLYDGTALNEVSDSSGDHMRALVEYALSKDVELVVYDAKVFYKKALVFGLKYSELAKLKIFDLMLADYLIEPEEKHDLASLLQRHLAIASDLLSPQTTSSFLKLHEKMKEDLEQASLYKLFLELEMPVALVLAELEKNGIAVDCDILEGLSKEYTTELKQIEEKIYKEVGETFNINSPKQLSVILFEKLKLPVISKTKTGYSTDAEVLGKLAPLHVVPALIQRYRELTKLKSTYVDVLPTLVSDDKRIHAKFNQAVAATGRLSGSDPNLQNIPIKTASGRKIRKAFVAKEGYTLIGADYSQIELRIIAELSQDAALIEAFVQNQDIHSITAAEIFSVPLKDVSSEKRSAAKAINFGLIYGKTAFGLAQELNISRGEAQKYIDSYFRKYPGVKKYLDLCIERARKNKLSETYFGRKRPIRDIDNKNMGVRNNAERMAMNTPVQGTAADIIKIAMIEVAKVCQRTGSNFILQVHDELVLEVPTGKVAEVTPLLKNAMENVVPEFKVKLCVEIASAQNWMDL